jgi:hypothetical protein
MSEREANEEATHGEVLRWSPTPHYVTTGLPNALASLLNIFWLPILIFYIIMIEPDDEAKGQDVGDGRTQDVQETKSQGGEANNTATQAQSSDDEHDNLPIAASIVGAPMAKIRAPRKRKEKRRTWEYVPAVVATATYWAGGVEGKRRRTMCSASYRDEDAQSDSENDPEELFRPQKEDECSSDDSGAEPFAKKKVPPPPNRPAPPANLAPSVPSRPCCSYIYL